MKRLGSFIIIATGLLISASCSSVSNEELLCRADIKSGLINPETVKFFDFKAIDTSKFRRGVENFVWREHNVLPNERGRFGDQLNAPINEIVQTATDHHASFWTLRVKAESRAGLHITSNYVCAVSEGECACLMSDA